MCKYDLAKRVSHIGKLGTREKGFPIPKVLPVAAMSMVTGNTHSKGEVTTPKPTLVPVVGANDTRAGDLVRCCTYSTPAYSSIYASITWAQAFASAFGEVWLVGELRVRLCGV